MAESNNEELVLFPSYKRRKIALHYEVGYRKLAPRQLAPNLIGQFQARYFILTWVLKYKMELTNQIRCELSWCELSVFLKFNVIKPKLRGMM